MDRRKPELLSPAGDMEKLRMAVAYGADAVYLAGTSFGMRSFTGQLYAGRAAEGGAAGPRRGREGPLHGQYHAPQ
ncbi:MAG: hypothetical protein ACLUFI_07615 [Oscillospiraceae bacterium]